MKSRQNIARIALAMMFLFGGIANVIILLINPSLYQEFSGMALIPAYKQIWAHVVIPNLYLLISLTVVFEWAIAALLLGKTVAVRVGAFCSFCFMAILIPFWWSGGALLNVGLGALSVKLLFAEYPSTVFNRK